MNDTIQYAGRSMVLLLAGHDAAGAEDWATFIGSLELRGAGVVWVHPDATVALPDEWIRRIQPVSEEVAEVVGSVDYLLPLSVGDLPSDLRETILVKTGLKWPM